MPPIIFHGDAGSVVHLWNGRSLAARSVASFPRLTAIAAKGRAPGGSRFSRRSHRTKTGKTFCEYGTVEGAGHALAGGDAKGSFTDPTGPDASREMLRFFPQHKLG